MLAAYHETGKHIFLALFFFEGGGKVKGEKGLGWSHPTPSCFCLVLVLVLEGNGFPLLNC